MIFKSKVPDIQVPESDLTSVVLTRVDELGEKAALVDGISGRSISYLQLRELIAKMATGLHLRGFKKGDVFATFMPNVPEYAVVFL
ncbi:MAG: AMP-binding protein, partial [Gammaproteobacteria bacterium]|nr:AMP-binding protein [Gammaproteobacteria bacterium]